MLDDVRAMNSGIPGIQVSQFQLGPTSIIPGLVARPSITPMRVGQHAPTATTVFDRLF